MSSSFTLIETTKVDSLNLEIHHYRHNKTGAVHYHLACDYDEKVFLVALRTMPKDSSGVAHILEHTALCGSEKYPVRDPFFMMTRRSLNSFMNAMTSSDWTAYPFASQNDKDFNNLLDVYLDAVFFSRLHPLDFAQEGHRLEFSEKGNPDSKLEYKGVVFNEMKGAMSSPVSQLWQGLNAALFPTNTYHYNSGGEPNCITDLSYDELLEFYQTHYHPSNAIFMTFGNLDVAALQQKLETQALHRFEKLDKHFSVPLEKRYSAPLAIEQRYALDNGELKQNTHHVVAWLLGESTDLDAQLEAHLVSQVLLDNSASPLRRALEESDLGLAPSPLCGLEDSSREMSFMCGLEGSEPEQAEAVEALVLATLEQVAQEGVPSEMIEASLHQLELHQREIGGDHYPYGLQLMFNSLSAAIHYGNPVALLNLEPALARLRSKASQADFMQEAVQRLLLNNRHRVRYSLRPDEQISAETKRLEEAQLASIASQLTATQKQQLIEQAQALQERQEQEDDADILPQVSLQDVRPQASYVAPHAVHQHSIKGTEYIAGTNGLLYQQLILDLPALNQEQLTWLPLFTQCWTEIGAGGQDYLLQQQKQTATVGSLSAYASIKSAVDDPNRLTGSLVMTGKALASKADAFSALMQESWQSADFSEGERLQDLLGQLKSRREQSITGNGHSLAMSLAASSLSSIAAVSDALSGLSSIKRLKERFQLAQAQGAAVLSTPLSELYRQLSLPQEVLLVHDEQGATAHLESVFSRWQAQRGQAQQLNWPIAAKDQLWQVDTQVNFCAWALPSVTMDHPDAPSLAVLSGVLRNAYLHTAIREKGGAYGAGATQDSALGCFKFYSYRDPRVEGTFDDFRASIDWVLNQANGEAFVEQAILGLIGSMDRPGSPAGEAKQYFHQDRAGRTRALRQTFRERLLACTWQDVQRVASQYLHNQIGSRAVLAGRGSDKLASNLGLIANDY